MRFRASVENVSSFSKIVQAIEKLQKKCVVKFTETDMHIICNSDVNEGGVQVWSQIKVSSIFIDYRIQSNANNQITVTLSSEALLAALRSAAAPGSTHASSVSGAEVIMKLAKKNDQAVLSFEITGTTRMGRHVRVAHDVRIEVMKPTDVERLTEPLCPEPDVHILLPPLTKLRTVIDRLRAHSDTIAVHANNAGSLKVSVGTDSVKTDVTWTGLTNPARVKDISGSQDPEPTPASQARDPEQMFGTLVSVKSFLKFLNSHVVSTTTIACICQNHCMILYVYIGEVGDAGGVLTFYIPAMLDD